MKKRGGNFPKVFFEFFRFRCFYSLCLLLFVEFGCAQNYPVQATTILNPPFSGYLPDFTFPGNENLKLLLVFNDFSKPSYNVKIKFRLSGQNINIQSKGYYYYGPVTLTPGQPLEISSEQLAALLDENNLVDGTSLNSNLFIEELARIKEFKDKRLL